MGVGGMGAVYRARDLNFAKMVRLVAVKEMINQARDPSIQKVIVQNFEREANILATLNHPAIPKIFDYFTQGERSYLVMEFINGKDLEVWVDESVDFLSEEAIIKWAIELCDVLSYLHQHEPEPIIFRDMKPSNVMLDQYGQLTLVDFGIAKPFQTGQRGTQVGTEGYSPPEQYRGDATPLADIYALGATLHHLITRRDPRLEAPFSFSERPVRKLNPQISMELEAVINTALQYNPEDRFSSAEAMKEALINVAKKTGMLAKMTFTSNISGSTTNMTASMVDGSVKPLWTFKCEDEIRGSPAYYAGRLYIGCYDNNLYSLDAASGEFGWKFPADGGIVSTPSILKDNITVGSEDGFLYSIYAPSGKVIWKYRTDGPVRSSPRIAEGHVFVGSDDGYLHVVNLTSSRRAYRVDAGAPIRSTPIVSEEYAYFGSEDGEFMCVNFSGEIKWRFRAKRGITSSPTISKGVIFFTSLDTTVYAVDVNAGWAIWRSRLGKPSISSPAIADGKVFVGAIDGNIYCLDEYNGKEVWRYQTENQVNGSPVVYKDALYCGSVDGSMYCLEYRTGRLRWKFSTERPITGTPVVYDDVVYFGSTDHNVYALLA